MQSENLEQKSETPKIFYDKLLENLNIKNPEKNYQYISKIKHVKKIPTYTLRLL